MDSSPAPAPALTAGVPHARVLNRIRALYPALRAAERRVADYLFESPGTMIRDSITAVAEAAGTSEATVVRLCKKAGLSGFQELKILVAQDLVAPAQAIHEEISPSDSVAEIKRKVFGSNAQALHDTLGALSDEAVERAVDAMANAGRIAFFGVGISGWLALSAQVQFTRIGLNCVAPGDAAAQSVVAALLRPGDVAVGVSHSGANKDIVRVLGLAREAGATTICITSQVRSPITKVAGITLLTSARETAFRTEAMSSRIAQLSIIDTLFVAVAYRRYEESVANIQKARSAMADRLY